jgi:anti-anti-sigma factor
MFELSKIGDKMLCKFSGRQDTTTCMEMEAKLSEVTGEKLPVTFDLKEVEYVSSAFLRLCLRVAKEVGTEKFAVVNLNPSVKKVFKIAGFDKLVKAE